MPESLEAFPSTGKFTLVCCLRGKGQASQNHRTTALPEQGCAYLVSFCAFPLIKGLSISTAPEPYFHAARDDRKGDSDAAICVQSAGTAG